MTYKHCTKCKELKLFSEFSKYARSKDGFRPLCKKCGNKISKEYKLTMNGVISVIYGNMNSHSKTKGYSHPSFTKNEFYNWIINHDKFKNLYESWVYSGHDKNLKPSCDRTDDYLGYDLLRLELMTWQENNKKGCMDRHNGINNKISKSVKQFSLSGSFIAEYYSLAHAGRTLNVRRSDISACCNGYQHTAFGFIWKHSN